jgi:hypothetical protein
MVQFKNCSFEALNEDSSEINDSSGVQLNKNRSGTFKSFFDSQCELEENLS